MWNFELVTFDPYLILDVPHLLREIVAFKADMIQSLGEINRKALAAATKGDLTKIYEILRENSKDFLEQALSQCLDLIIKRDSLNFSRESFDNLAALSSLIAKESDLNQDKKRFEKQLGSLCSGVGSYILETRLQTQVMEKFNCLCDHIERDFDFIN